MTFTERAQQARALHSQAQYQLDTIPADADAAVAELQAQVADLEARLATATADDATDDALTAELRHQLAAAETALGEQRATAEQQAARLIACAGTVAERDALIVQLRARIAELETVKPSTPAAPAGFVSLLEFWRPGMKLREALTLADAAAAKVPEFKLWLPKRPLDVPVERAGDEPGVWCFDADWSEVLDPRYTDPAANKWGLDYAASVLQSLGQQQYLTEVDGEAGVTMRLRRMTSTVDPVHIQGTSPTAKDWRYATCPLGVWSLKGRIRRVGPITLDLGKQQHNYHGFGIWQPITAGGVDEHLQYGGGQSTGGHPPTECFGESYKGAKDWRRTGRYSAYTMDGEQVGGVGITWQESPGFTVASTYVNEGCLASSLVAYQTVGWTVEPGALIIRDAVNETAWGSGCFVNIERSPGGRIGGTFRGGSVGDDVHVSYAGDHISYDRTGRITTATDHRLTFLPGFKLEGPALWSADAKGRPQPVVRVWSIATPNTAYPRFNSSHWSYEGNPVQVQALPTWTDTTGEKRIVHTVAYGRHVQLREGGANFVALGGRMPAESGPTLKDALA